MTNRNLATLRAPALIRFIRPIRPAALSLVVLTAALGLAIAAPAAADPPLEVEVTNDATAPVPVSVENELEVFVANGASEPVAVSVERRAPEVPILISLSAWDYTHMGDVMLIEEVNRICVGVQPSCFDVSGPYYVPEDKVLIIESIGVGASVANGSPTTMAADFAIEPPGHTEFVFPFGRADYVHPKSKTWQTSFIGKLRAPAGSKIRGGVFWNEDVASVGGVMNISGVLVDAPEPLEDSLSMLHADEVDTGDLRSVSPNDAVPAAFPTAR